MIVYNLACDKAHTFEGWFASPEAFERQLEADSVSCPVCGSSGVAKQPFAPHIGKPSTGVDEGLASLSPEAMNELRAKVIDYVLKNTEDVGKAFAEEARKIHRRDAPERPIRGQATQQEAQALKEEGIDVVRLPVAPVPPEQLH